MVKLTEIRLLEHVAHMGMVRNLYKNIVGESEGERSFRKLSFK
jgi:hypothetical protein